MTHNTFQATNRDPRDGKNTALEQYETSKKEQKLLDDGPEISLDDYLVAAYLLNPNELCYNYLGMLSELPPDAYELNIKLRKRVKTSPDGLVGYKAELAGFTCHNLSRKEKNYNWKFPVRAYLEESENIELCKSTNYINLYFQRLRAYSFWTHVKSYTVFTSTLALFISIIVALITLIGAHTLTLSSIVQLIFELTPLIFILTTVFCLVFYILIWQQGILFLESRKNKNPYTPSTNPEEIRKWIRTIAKTKTEWKNEAKKIIENALIATPNTKIECLSNEISSDEQQEIQLTDYSSALHKEDYAKIVKRSNCNLFSTILLMLTGKLMENGEVNDKQHFSNTEEAIEWIEKEIRNKKLHLTGFSQNYIKYMIASNLEPFSHQHIDVKKINLNNDESYTKIIEKWINILKKKEANKELMTEQTNNTKSKNL